MNITVLDQRIRTARKTHTCSYAGCRIAPRERYEVQSNVMDGSAFTWKSCLWHAAWAKWIFSLWSWEYQDGLGWDDMYECINNEWCEAEADTAMGRDRIMPFDWELFA